MVGNNVLLVLGDNRGISTFPAVYQSAMELKKRNDLVSILTNVPCDDPTLEKVFDKYIITSNTDNWIYEMSIVNKIIIESDYDIVIAFSTRDAINCCKASLFKKNITFYYYNLEIYERTIRKKDKLLLDEFNIKKLLEKIYTHRCKALVIQDNIRMKISKKHGIKHRKTFLIPNSYYKNFQDEKNIKNKNEKLKILYSGSLETWSVKPIMQNRLLINDERYLITLSGWSRDRYIYEMSNEKIGQNLKIRLEKLGIAEYRKLVYSHDIGLVWYSDELTDNVYNIGRSSGKYYMYISCCKPVIVKNLPGLAEEVIENGFGVVIDSLDQLTEACEEIYNNYDFYCTNIKNVYDEKIDYSNVSQNFFDYINS